MRIVSVLSLLLLAFAGCADEGAPPEEDDPFKDLDATPTEEGKGIIRGVVIDAAITPVEGATIKLVGAALETASNADGAFVFNDLDPGTYFLEATKVGFSTVQQSTEVVAGVAQPAIVKVLLEHLPGTEPRAQTFEDVGVINCGWGVPITYGYCGEDIGNEDDPSLNYDITGSPDFIQIEIIWENTQPLSENLYMINAVCPPDERDICPGGTPFEGDAPYRWDEGTWTSPAIMRSPAGYMQEAREYHGLETMDGWMVGVDVSADGPALATGVTIDQEFRGYVTMFWNITPDEDWTFYEDGAYPTPS